MYYYLGLAFVVLMLFIAYRALSSKGKPLEQSCTLLQRQVINHDTVLLKFGGDARLTVGKHIAIQATIAGEEVTRKYTPISSVQERSHFDLLIKIYRPTDRFPKGGLMTQWLQTLKVGQQINIRSPYGRFNYPAPGRVSISGPQPIDTHTKSFLMIAGGSGITPCYQVAHQILRNPNDSTKLCIIFANKTEQDILMRKELEKLNKSGCVHIIFTVDIKPDDPSWQHYIGFVDQRMVKDGFQKLGDQSPFCLLCGPGPMVNLGFKIFKGQGIPENRIFSF